MREKYIEQRLVKAVKAAGGMAPKFISPSLAGIPDRLVLLPKGKMAFIEVKRSGMKLRPLQIKRHKTLKRLGFKVYVLDEQRQIEVILNEIQAT